MGGRSYLTDFGLALFACLMLASPASIQAAEDPAPAAQPSKEDDRSYLPPWMQGQDTANSNGVASANSAANAENGGAPAVANADQALAKGPSQQQQKPRRSRSSGFLGSLAGLFGR